jgi:sugar/nucleoside kinase (ribokinase family)
MLPVRGIEPIDYLIIGHLSQDIKDDGPQLGGSVAYAALTAKAMGMRVGMVTSWGEELSLMPLEGIQVVNLKSEHSTTFENLYTSSGRLQTIHHVADKLDFHMVPEMWRSASIVHLAPIAREVSPALVRQFPNALLGLTLQGWLREWDEKKRVSFSEWPEASYVLSQVNAAVLSIQDVNGDWSQIDGMARSCPVLVVTLGEEGANLYWEGEVHHIAPPQVDEVGPTGAGDIFAGAFFIRFSTNDDPIEAVRFANHVAARSVTRHGLDSAPTVDEIYDLVTEVIL